MKTVTSRLVGAALSLALVSPAAAQPATAPAPAPAKPAAAPMASAAALPSADTVIEEFIAAAGGRPAFQKLRSLSARGTFTIPKMNVSGTLELDSAAPRKMYLKVELSGLGTQESGTDGTTAWERSTATGARVLGGAEKDDALRNATFNGELSWKKQFKKAEVVGKEAVAGKDAWKVLFTRKDDSTETRFYDVASKLPVRTEQTARTKMGQVPVVMTMANWKPVAGVLMPHTLEQSMMGMTQVMTLTALEANATLPAARFAVPADIKKLKK